MMGILELEKRRWKRRERARKMMKRRKMMMGVLELEKRRRKKMQGGGS